MKKTYTEAKLELVRLNGDVVTASGSSCRAEMPCDGD